MSKFACFRTLLLFATALLINHSAFSQSQKKLSPKELLSVENPRSVKMSPDGNKVIALTQKGSLEKNRYLQSAWLLTANSDKAPINLKISNRVQAVEWFPDSERFAYLTRTRRGSQLFIKRIGEKSASKISKNIGMVRDFSISPDGKKIALNAINRKAMVKARRAQKKKQMGSGGKEINMLTSSAMTMATNRPSRRRRPATKLKILNLENNRIKTVVENYSVDEFSWSPDNDKIALTAKKSTLQSSGVPARRSDLLLFNLQTDDLSVIKEGKQPTNKIFDGVVAHYSPFWSPNGNIIGYSRIDHSDRWGSLPQLGIYNIKKEKTRYLTTPNGQDLYSARFNWISTNKIYVEFTNKAKRGLYSISVATGDINSVKVSKVHRSNFSFSSEGEKAAWVQQSVGQPPEIHVSKISSNASSQISNFNDEIDSYSFPQAEYLTWESEDGSEVQGWLIVPEKEAHGKKRPLITLVHGGPSLAMTNKFQPFMQQWPYPIHIWAKKGYQIFIPNYRGTGSFGKQFMNPSAYDDEPVKDIVTGLENLISKGVADKNKLGIIGHSHGGWLGPMVAAQKPVFDAASFAEGFGNFASLYGQMQGYRNKDLHDYTIGTNPYEDPERYLELSPIFKKDFVQNVPTLLEFGQRSPVVLQGIELGKAFWRSGTPHSLVVYPNTGHNITKPKYQLESMNRNLRWFNKWLED